MSGPLGLVREGGLLMITSAYNWSADVCDPQLWLCHADGGRGDKASPVAGLQAALGGEFVLEREAELPRMQHGSARQCSITVLHATVWRRAVQRPYEA